MPSARRSAGLSTAALERIVLQQMRGAELEPNDKAILTVEKMHFAAMKLCGLLREIQAKTGSR